MKLLKNRAFAALVMVVVILISFLASGHRALARERDKVSDLFYNGELGDGVGIAYDLDTIAVCCGNLVTVASRYLSADNSALSALNELRSEMAGAATISEKAKCFSRIDSVVMDVAEALDGTNITSTDFNLFYGECVDIDAAQQRIKLDSYNTAARQFNDSLSGQPAAFIAALTGIAEAEIFH